MWTLITYDIANDRNRDKIAHRLLDDATRVQKSVFEATELDQNRYLRLRSDLEGLFDPTTDSLRYYRLCGGCATRIEHVGTGIGRLIADPRFRILG